MHLFDFLQNHRLVGYIVIFFGMIFEGDIFLFTAYFLTHLGFFDPVNMFLTTILGVSMGDLGWYWLGVRLHNRFSWLRFWADKVAAPFDEHLKRRPLRTIFLSKFTYGVHHAILMRAGALGMKLEQFIPNDWASNLFWITIVGGLGFLSSASFTAIRHRLKIVELGLLIGLLIFFVFWHIVAIKAKRRL